MQLMTATSDQFPTFPLCQNYLKDLPCLDCNRISSVPRITVPFSLHTEPYIPLKPLCSRSLMISTDRWTMVPLLPWSASTFPLLTIPLITVFFPVICSIDGKALAWIQSYLRDRHSFVQDCRWTAQPLVNNHAMLVFHRVVSSVRCSSRPTSHRSVMLSANSVSVITHTLMIHSCTLKWTGSRTASAVSSTGSCATTCYWTEASLRPSSLGLLNVMLGRCSHHRWMSQRESEAPLHDVWSYHEFQ